MGVWERAPKTNRLHFHGLFNIPEGTMSGEIEEYADYNLKSKRITTTFQNTFFNKKFGRSDFVPIDTKADLMEELSYIMKYIEKTQEPIVYSKNLPQYFLSDILDRDVVSTIGQEDKKLLLFDDFLCVSEGVIMGKAGSKTFEQMPTSN